MAPLAAQVATAKLPPTLLAQPLRRLRSRLARWFWVDGLTRASWTAIGIACFDVGLDRWLKLDRSQRAIMLLLAIGVLGFVVWRHLVRPLLVRLSDDALCLEVELRQRELGQKLISALQLARDDNWQARGISPQLAEAVIQSGLDAAAGANWSGVLDQRRERRNAGLLAAAVGLVALVVGLSLISPLPGIWWRRNIQLSNEKWPQSSYLVFDGLREGRLRVPRGESFTVRVSVDPASRVTPDRVQLEFRPARGRGAVTMNSVSPGTFEHQLQRVIESFEIRAAGGDAETDWTAVEMVEPPTLGQLGLEVQPPAYTKLPSAVLPAGAGPHAILEGSRCRLAAVANKPLAAARLVHERGEWAARIGDDNRVEWELAEQQVHAGRYSIYLEDREGIRPQQPLTFVLQVQPDRAPKVEAKLMGVGGTELPNTRDTWEVRVRDDFAVQSARILWQARADEEASTLEPAAVALPAFEPFKGRTEAAFQDSFDLTPLNLGPGRTLTFVIEAEDNDERDGPNRGRSVEFLLRIVTPDELRDDWLRREKEQRQELEQVLRTQEELLTDTQALAAAAQVTENDRTAISGLSRRQKQAAQQVAAIAQRLDTIAAEVINNRLAADPDRLADRLRRELVAPLTAVAEQTAAEALQSLDEARRTVDDDAQRQRALQASTNAERKTAEELKNILERMLKSEGFQEAVQLLYQIQKAQQDVFDRTQREKQQRIEAILRGSGKKE